jgi:hypothetical protein
LAGVEPVTDVSQNGTDTDTDNDGESADDNEPTPLVILALVAIPTMDTWALLAVAAILAAVALRRMS